MAAARMAVARLVIDLTILAIVGLTVLFINLFAYPFRRGFFCNDESIKYPHLTSTVSSLAVGLGSLLIPVAIFGVIEISNPGRCRPSSIVGRGTKTLPRCVIKWLKLSAVFLFGAGSQQLIVDVAKVWLGRLRPYFLDVCRPDMSQQCTLNGTMLYTYVTDYTCTGADESQIDEGRLSFPSGHAALSCYAAVFVVMYLQCAYPWHVSKLLKHVLQFALLMGAWFTSLSRVTDYQHHWSDVLGGMAVGSLAAVLTVVFISDLECTCSRQRQLDDEEDDMTLMTREASTGNRLPTTATFDRPGNGASVQIIV